MHRFFYNLGKNTGKLFTQGMGRMVVIGRERVPDGGVLIAANHTSYVDPVMLGVAMSPRPIWFMAKSELFDIPLFGPFIRRLQAFPVHRGTVDRQALRRAHELLTLGEPVVVFFEGTRSGDGRLRPAEPGAAMIAQHAGVPIVPTAVIDADRLLPRGSLFLRFCRTKVAFGTPIYPVQGEGGRAAIDRLSHELMARMAALMREHGAAERVPESYPPARPEGAACE